MRAVVTGLIATYPIGGVLWDYGQYALGLERLGYEVYYLEDAGVQTYNPLLGDDGDDCSYAIQFLEDSLGYLSPELGRRWHFRAADGRRYGLDRAEFKRVLETCDLFLNVSGSALMRDEYLGCRNKVLIDTDPGWNHFVNYPMWDECPGWDGTHGFRGHDHFFTYAESIRDPSCNLPTFGIDWHPTRPPVVLDCWRSQGAGERWTTVMSWNEFPSPVVYEGNTYGTKVPEFIRVESLPSFVETPLEIAVGGDEALRDHWRKLGWSVVESHAVSTTAEVYRDYIQESLGEFSVAKNVYVETGSGWFSCRSACYLAAGRPTVVQDTGFSRHIPTGHGLFAFSGIDQAVAALNAVVQDYKHHQAAAREIAERWFSSATVLGALLDQIGLDHQK
jgi:hypothetical protein